MRGQSSERQSNKLTTPPSGKFTSVTSPALENKAEPRESRALLHARRERPRDCCAAEQRDELAASHAITSSARASSVGGISNPMRLAVLRLITSSNFVDWMTGKSAGLAPLRMRPA